jgi:hypothetical protein
MIVQHRQRSRLIAPVIGLALLLSLAPLALAAGDTLVSVGSPPSPFSQNKQNEPALAVDAAHPNVLVAGSNDNIDMEACNAGDDTTCPFTTGIGGSGVYFSFDSGATWTQPTYTGLTARGCTGVVGPDAGCTPVVGPIGTLPWYYEEGLVSDGDPALAFGPVPDASGHFSWDNGSRLYYANLSSNLSAVRSEANFRGYEAVAVSRTDDVEAAAGGDKNAWMRPVIVSRQASTTFSDKEQIWADNAATSRFFGNVYVCGASFRSNSLGLAYPVPIMVARSSDGGSTWSSRQVTSAVSNNQHGGRTGCTIRTDSDGVVYLAIVHFAIGTPGIGSHELLKSYDGGRTWTQPQRLFAINDACYNIDPVIGRCVEDGIAGARMDLAAAPSLDIANGAPTGADATNEIVDTWVDGRDGLNNEAVMVSYSTNGGRTWSAPARAQSPGDRGYYSAAAFSPNGTDLYLVYNAYTTPYRDNTTDPRVLVGVIKHADIGAGGAPTGWTEVHRGATGDPRASSQNNLQAEFLGDYVYAAATRTYGAGVWNDVRNGADCPAMDAWRMALRTGDTSVATPAPQQDCPATFGNTDIYGAAILDPTP